MRATLAAALAAALLGLTAPALRAHGDLHNQIADLDQRIAATPNDAALVLRRAELHRIHREWAAADGDYARVLALEPRHPEAAWLRARGALEAGNAATALAQLDRYLAEHPDHAGARLTRARALMASARAPEAVADYATAVEKLPQPEPDHFLEWVEAQRAAGLPPGTQLATIDRGLRRLGPVPALEALGLEIELGTGRFDAALARLDRQVAVAARKEALLFRRAQVLERAGRRDEALGAYRASLDAIERLPETLRGVKAIGHLSEQARQALRGLDDPPRAIPGRARAILPPNALVGGGDPATFGERLPNVSGFPPARE
jgi:tetratricopeptide (TPR) repeat protein